MQADEAVRAANCALAAAASAPEQCVITAFDAMWKTLIAAGVCCFDVTRLSAVQREQLRALLCRLDGTSHDEMCTRACRDTQLMSWDSYRRCGCGHALWILNFV
jgi:hypothetical protein